MTARRALLAWELGGGYGHVARLRAIARALRDAGHACAFAVRDLAPATDYVEAQLGPVLQAPVRLHQPKNPVPTQTSYASLLHNVGFENPRELAARIRAWRDLMRALRTELVFADHSPIALLAAQSLSLPCTVVGTGFTVPPLVEPFPSFRPAMKIGEEILRRNEAAVLAELNQALALLKLAPLASLRDLFGGARMAALTYAELDPYAAVRTEPQLGHPPLAQGAAVEWPAGDGPRLFGYLRPSPLLTPLLDALAATRTRALIRVSGVTAAALARYVRPGLAIVDHTVDVAGAAQTADAYVCDGAHGTVCEFLLAGKPGLLLPTHHEHLLLTRSAAALGAAVGVNAAAGVGRGLAQLLEDPSLRVAAEAFATRHRSQRRESIVPELVQRALAAKAA
jgi:UDP:flavonoid glycosyltransferase YjiC (YdhE family)